MYRGILTGLNSAFIIDQATRDQLIKADPTSRDLIKPMLRGEDLRPWYQEDEGRWLICLPSGWTARTFPEIKSLESLALERISLRYPRLATYLESVEKIARQHTDSGQFWWEWGPNASAQTNLSPIFFLDDATREKLQGDASESAAFIEPLSSDHQSPLQREQGKNWLLVLPNGWTLQTFPELETLEPLAWEKLAARHPALTIYLEPFADAARRRQDKGQFWWELRPCDYYDAFEGSKIFWADIARYPRFSWDEQGLFINNKGYILPSAGISLLGILQSRAIWFCITRLCAPLGERAGLIIYQHFTQFIERLPIPRLSDEQRMNIGVLSQQITEVARRRYQIRKEMTERITSDLGTIQGKPTQRLNEWWTLSWQAFRDEVRKSFKQDIPLKERREWETLLQEQRTEIEQLTAQIIKLEEALNAAVYTVFGLSDEDITLIEQETKYQYGEW